MNDLLGKRIMLRAILGFLSSILPFASSQASCPDLSANETQLDCPWAQISRDTTKLDAQKDAKKIRKIFKHEAPGFLKQFTVDLSHPLLFSSWGLSRNADESSLDQFIVAPNLLSFFAQELNVTPYDPSFKYGNAGLNHTYGYVFSTLQTPYGYKRARYVRNEIESGFGLSAGIFSPHPKHGSLLSNLTFFIGKISIPESFSSHASWGDVPDELKKFDYKKLKIQRLVETVESGSSKLVFRTDIIPFPNPPLNATAATDSELLIYTIDEGQGPKLITAFPVNASFGTGLFKPEAMGDHQEIKLKYNAWIHTTPPPSWIGKREKFEL